MRISLDSSIMTPVSAPYADRVGRHSSLLTRASNAVKITACGDETRPHNVLLRPHIKTEAAMQKTIDEPDTSELTFPYDMGLIVD